MAKAKPIRSRKLWRGVLAGAAAVPLAVFAAAPAVSAAGMHTSESAQTEQVPELPVGEVPVDVPGGLDPTALLDLQQCLTDLQTALGDTAGEVPDPGGEVPLQEQLPGLPAPVPGQPVPAPGDGTDVPTVPDLAMLNETCQSVLATVTGASDDLPDTPVPDPGVDNPLPVDP